MVMKTNNLVNTVTVYHPWLQRMAMGNGTERHNFIVYQLTTINNYRSV